MLVIIDVGFSSPNIRNQRQLEKDAYLTHPGSDRVNDFLEVTFLISGNTKIAPFSLYKQIGTDSCAISPDSYVDNSSPCSSSTDSSIEAILAARSIEFNVDTIYLRQLPTSRDDIILVWV